MFCSECGAKLKENSMFCSICGQRLQDNLVVQTPIIDEYTNQQCMYEQPALESYFQDQAQQDYINEQYMYEVPIPEAILELIQEPIPEPISEPIPGPIPGPIPEPISEPIPEPIPEPILEPIQEPIPEPIPEPILEIIPEPKQESIPNINEKLQEEKTSDTSVFIHSDSQMNNQVKVENIYVNDQFMYLHTAEGKCIKVPITDLNQTKQSIPYQTNQGIQTQSPMMDMYSNRQSMPYQTKNEVKSIGFLVNAIAIAIIIFNMIFPRWIKIPSIDILENFVDIKSKYSYVGVIDLFSKFGEYIDDFTFFLIFVTFIILNILMIYSILKFAWYYIFDSKIEVGYLDKFYIYAIINCVLFYCVILGLNAFVGNKISEFTYDYIEVDSIVGFTIVPLITLLLAIIGRIKFTQMYSDEVYNNTHKSDNGLFNNYSKLKDDSFNQYEGYKSKLSKDEWKCECGHINRSYDTSCSKCGYSLRQNRM